jgi:hypothetical protein
LFVSDLIGYLDGARLFDESICLDGKPIRALQLADDLAMVASSAGDLQRLLDQWESYCDHGHLETQIRKTEIVVYTTAEDARRCHAVGGVLRLPAGKSLYRLVDFTYKNANVAVVDAFTYLGVFLASAIDATAAWEAREASGSKAHGAAIATLRAAPFLPFHRTLEVCSGTTGGAYLYSAEMWGPFLPAEGSALGEKFSRWMLGFWRTRADRRLGWVEICDLDDKALSRAVRVIEDANFHKGLLLRAVRQFCLNWEMTAPRERASSTWVGRLTKRVRHTWPQFRISAGTEGSLVVQGTPGVGNVVGPSRVKLATSFYEQVRNNKWIDRQISVFSSKPTLLQQDYVIFHIIRKRIGTQIDISNVSRADFPISMIFRTKPSVCVNTFRTLLRFLAGLEDFARVNAHYSRREAHPSLAHPNFKRSCLSCCVRRNTNVLDSEWHTLFDCPATAAPRALFNHAFPIERFSSAPHLVSGIVALTIASGDNVNLTNEFSRWVVGALACRRREFRALSP